MKNNESKYKQVVNFVIDSIAEGKLQKGDWIPSINEFRENYHLSRDTVFAGLSELKSRGIIASTPGVGYYIASGANPLGTEYFPALQRIQRIQGRPLQLVHGSTSAKA